VPPASSDHTEPQGPVPGTGLQVRAWVVRDTGLAPAPPRHRRLPGALRHHRGEGPAWPAEVVLRLEADHLEVPGVGRWPLAEVEVAVVTSGPPVVVSLAVPGTRQLLGAPHDEATAALLARLARPPGGPSPPP